MRFSAIPGAALIGLDKPAADEFAGRIAVITGGGSGIGRSTALLLARLGAKVHVVDIAKANADAVAAEIVAAGGSAAAYRVDVSKPAGVEKLADQVFAADGRVDVLFNNAGIVRGNKYFWETEDPRDITTTMGVNSLAPMYITREFLADMIAGSGEKRIVNIASSAALVSNPRMAVYAASKWAALGFSDSVRLELEQ